jgi:hypothetical protein
MYVCLRVRMYVCTYGDMYVRFWWGHATMPAHVMISCESWQTFHAKITHKFSVDVARVDMMAGAARYTRQRNLSHVQCDFRTIMEVVHWIIFTCNATFTLYVRVGAHRLFASLLGISQHDCSLKNVNIKRGNHTQATMPFVSNFYRLLLLLPVHEVETSSKVRHKVEYATPHHEYAGFAGFSPLVGSCFSKKHRLYMQNLFNKTRSKDRCLREMLLKSNYLN